MAGQNFLHWAGDFFSTWPWSSRIHQALCVQFVGEIYQIIQVYIYIYVYVYVYICIYIYIIIYKPYFHWNRESSIAPSRLYPMSWTLATSRQTTWMVDVPLLRLPLGTVLMVSSWTCRNWQVSPSDSNRDFNRFLSRLVLHCRSFPNRFISQCPTRFFGLITPYLQFDGGFMIWVPYPIFETQPPFLRTLVKSC